MAAKIGSKLVDLMIFFQISTLTIILIDVWSCRLWFLYTDMRIKVMQTQIHRNNIIFSKIEGATSQFSW